MNRKVNLLTGEIRPTLLRLSLPLALTAFIQIAYGFVDTIWIARLGTDAVAGVGIAGFIFWIGNSIVLIPKVGMGVCLLYTSPSPRDKRLSRMPSSA